MFRRDQIHLKRGVDLVRNIGVLTGERLTTNNDELLFASDAAGSAQHMINLLLLHSVFSLPLSEVIRRMAPIAEVGPRSRRVRASLQKALRRLFPPQCLAILCKPH